MKTLYYRKELNPCTPVTLTQEEVAKSMEQAYELARRGENNKEKILAWKLGGTTQVTRTFFNIDDIYWGMLYESEIFYDSSKILEYPLAEYKGELEIALRLKEGFSLDSTTNYANIFDKWCFSIEMPSTPIQNLKELGINALIADRCAAGALILYKVFDYTENCLPVNQNHTLYVANTAVSGNTSVLLYPPEKCAQLFLQKAVELGFIPKAGQWIATGGLGECVKIGEISSHSLPSKKSREE